MTPPVPPVLFTANAWQVRRIGSDNEDAIQALAERCADYAYVCEGRPVSASAAREFLAEAPPGRAADEVFKLGVFASGGNLVGLMEAVADYPEAGSWHLGLMLLDPDVRRQGNGARLYAAFAEWVAAQDGTAIRLSVVEDNDDAFRFWRRMGFLDVQTSPPQRIGNKTQTVTEMRQLL